MPDTGEDREIKQRINANEEEVVRESKKFLQKARADLNTTKKEPGTWPVRQRSKPKN